MRNMVSNPYLLVLVTLARGGVTPRSPDDDTEATGGLLRDGVIARRAAVLLLLDNDGSAVEAEEEATDGRLRDGVIARRAVLLVL